MIGETKTAIIKIKDGNSLPLDSNHVLLYEDSKGYYYGVKIKDLFAMKDKEIDELEKKHAEEIESIKKENEKFKKDITDKYNKMVVTMKETSQTLIDMVSASSKEE